MYERRSIPNYPHYEVDNEGNVYSIDRTIGNRSYRGRMLKPGLSAYGYFQVVLYDDDRNRKNLVVHRLVATTFIPPVNGKHYVNHKDGCKNQQSPR